MFFASLNVYVCSAGSLGLRNHLAVRDHLRARPEAVAAYAALKRQLAADTGDLDLYTQAKTDLLAGILEAEGFTADEVESIRAQNRPLD